MIPPSTSLTTYMVVRYSNPSQGRHRPNPHEGVVKVEAGPIPNALTLTLFKLTPDLFLPQTSTFSPLYCDSLTLPSDLYFAHLHRGAPVEFSAGTSVAFLHAWTEVPPENSTPAPAHCFCSPCCSFSFFATHSATTSSS